jgi:hypothetical protein
MFMVFADPATRRVVFVQPDSGQAAPTEILCVSLDGKRIAAPSQLLFARLPELPPNVHSLNCARWRLADDGLSLIPFAARSWPARPAGPWPGEAALAAPGSLAQARGFAWPGAQNARSEPPAEEADEPQEAEVALSAEPAEPLWPAEGLAPEASRDAALEASWSLGGAGLPGGLWFLRLYLRQEQCQAFRKAPGNPDLHPIVLARAEALGLSAEESAASIERDLAAVLQPLAAAEAQRQKEAPAGQLEPQPTASLAGPGGEPSADGAWAARAHLRLHQAHAAVRGQGSAPIAQELAVARGVSLAEAGKELLAQSDALWAHVSAQEASKEASGAVADPLAALSEGFAGADGLWFVAMHVRLSQAGSVFSGAPESAAPIVAERAKRLGAPLADAAAEIIGELSALFSRVNELEALAEERAARG